MVTSASPNELQSHKRSEQTSLLAESSHQVSYYSSQDSPSGISKASSGSDKHASATQESPAAALPPHSWAEKKLLLCLTVSTLLSGCCLVIQLPFFTHAAHVRGLSSAVSGTVFSCFSLVQMLGFPVMGWLAPRLGVKRLFTLGLLLAGVTTAAFGLLDFVQRPNPFVAWCLVVRSVESLGTAAMMAAARLIVFQQFPHRVNAAMSLVEGAFGAGMCVGPAIGGGMYSLGGYGAPFYTIGTLLLATAAVSVLVVPSVTDAPEDAPERDVGRQRYRDMLRLVLSTADNWLIIAALLVPAANWEAVDTNLEPHVRATLGMQPAELSLFFTLAAAGYVLFSPLWGRLSDAVDNTFLLVAGCQALTALGVLLISPSPLLGLGPSRLLLGLGMTVRDVFHLGGYLPLLPLMVRRSNAAGLERGVRGQALVSSLHGAAYSLGHVIGPIGGGLVTDHFGFPAMATGIGGVSGALCLVVTVRGLAHCVKRRASAFTDV